MVVCSLKGNVNGGYPDPPPHAPLSTSGVDGGQITLMQVLHQGSPLGMPPKILGWELGEIPGGTSKLSCLGKRLTCSLCGKRGIVEALVTRGQAVAETVTLTLTFRCYRVTMAPCLAA